MKSVAFLRAINVGGHVVRMEELRRLFLNMKFAGVETFIASGNVIFDTSSKDSETRIEKGLQAALGYPVATFVRTLDELSAVAQFPAFPDQSGKSKSTLYIGFLKVEPAPELQRAMLAFSSANDELRIQGREIYWRSQSAFRDSKISGALIEKTLKTAATLRNCNTVQKIVSKYS